MRVHHLSCGSMRPFGGPLVRNGEAPGEAPHLVCHCLLVETEAGLVLVDTGFGTRDVARPDETVHPALRALARPALDPREPAVRQVEALGFAAADVRHVVVTHLDVDHAGGLRDFPEATVHLLGDELAAARAPRTVLERQRYVRAQWGEVRRWETYAPEGDTWRGLEAVRDLRGLPPEILLVPLTGHTRGHTGVAVDTGDRWLLHCGDAYFYRGEVAAGRLTCPAGLRLFQRVVQVDGRRRLDNRRRLRELAAREGDGVRVFCAHDPVELARLAAEATAAAGGPPVSPGG